MPESRDADGARAVEGFDADDDEVGAGEARVQGDLVGSRGPGRKCQILVVRWWCW